MTFENVVDPPENPFQLIDQILCVSKKPAGRSASDQRTSGTSEELLERPVRVVSLEMEPLTAATARKPTRSKTRETTGAAREASSSTAVATAVLQPFLPKLVINFPLLGVGQDFVGLGDVGKLLGGPLLLFLVLVRVVLER